MFGLKRHLLFATAALIAVSGTWAGEAEATTTTATMAVTATALSACVIVATPLAFGNYTQTLLAASASLTVTCTATTAYTIALDKGTTTGATFTNRLLYNITAGTTLAYSLFTDSGHSNPWTSNTVAGTGTGLVQTVNVYGTIAAGLQSAPGAYADLVTATLTY